MKKILAFGASSSTKSINKKLATHTASQIKDAEVNLIDLNDFEMPLFSVDKQAKDGIHEKAMHFKKLIEESDAVVISFAEHNGSYSAVFKNLLDWASRLEGKLWMNKPMFLLATSPGGRGAKTVLGLAETYFPYLGGQVVASFSLPSFTQNFSEEEGIMNKDLSTGFLKQLDLFAKTIR